MPGPLAKRLAARGLLALDGGLATELECDGFDLDDPLWSGRVLVDDPDAIERVHARFVAAGADIVTTATYQVTLQGLAAQGVKGRAAEAVFARATQLARNAAEGSSTPPTPLVAGSAGSYGAFLADGSEYRGEYGVDIGALTDFHRARAEILAESCDIVAFETVPCLDEARAIASVTASMSAECSVWVSFSCRDDATVCSGDAIEDCVAALASSPRVEAVGINCTHPDHIEGLLHRIRGTVSLPIVIYPNAGEHYDKAWSGTAEPPEAFGERASRWIDAGARVLGGCCRCGPAYVRALRLSIDRAARA